MVINIYIPWQIEDVHTWPLEHASLEPHLHAPTVQVSDLPEQTSLAPHLHTPPMQVSEVPEQSPLF